MRYNEVPRERQRPYTVACAILVVLGVAVLRLPHSQAQMRYSGGYILTHQYPPIGLPRIADLNKPSPSSNATSPDAIPSYFPDNDHVYWSYSPVPVAPPAPPPSKEPPDGISLALLPWNQAGFEEYDEDAELSPESSLSTPGKYSLEVTPVTGATPVGKAKTSLLIVHLPQHTLFWVEGVRTALKGPTSYFQSPRLAPGKKYHYTVRAAWIEEGHWVNQTQQVAVEAGRVQAIYLRSLAIISRTTANK